MGQRKHNTEQEQFVDEGYVWELVTQIEGGNSHACIDLNYEKICVYNEDDKIKSVYVTSSRFGNSNEFVSDHVSVDGYAVSFQLYAPSEILITLSNQDWLLYNYVSNIYRLFDHYELNSIVKLAPSENSEACTGYWDQTWKAVCITNLDGVLTDVHTGTDVGRQFVSNDVDEQAVSFFTDTRHITINLEDGSQLVYDLNSYDWRGLPAMSSKDNKLDDSNDRTCSNLVIIDGREQKVCVNNNGSWYMERYFGEGGGYRVSPRGEAVDREVLSFDIVDNQVIAHLDDGIEYVF